MIGTPLVLGPLRLSSLKVFKLIETDCYKSQSFAFRKQAFHKLV